MKQILTDIIEFANTGTVSPLLKPSLDKMHPTKSTLIAERLLVWVHGQAALRRAHPSKKDFRPLRVQATQSWYKDLYSFIANNPATSEVFELISDTVRLRDSISTEERIEMENYVLVNFDVSRLLIV